MSLKKDKSLYKKADKSNFLSKKQLKSIVALLLFILICTLPILSANLTEDISTMLPPGKDGRITKDFKLLQKSPLSGKILISISGKKGQEADLSAIADSLISRMDPSLLSEQRYSGTTPQAIINYLLQKKANLTTARDIASLEEITTESTIQTTLRRNKQQLLSPAGFGLKSIIKNDPLNMRSIYLQKINNLRNLPRFKIEGKHFLNKDKTALLIIAESPVAMTDSKGAAELLSHFNEIRLATLSENKATDSDIKISLLSGHLYTNANANIIKNDILTVSLISAGALALLFFACFRRRGAVSVFLAPAVAILTGLGVTTFLFRPMSAIVIGFGAVLMGISIDFAVHTYYALAENPADKNAGLRKIVSPVLYGAATSCAAFAALYVSGIPGIKQLAVFSVAGIIASCAYALLFIPNICNNFPEICCKKSASSTKKISPKMAMTSIILFISIATGAAFSNSLDPELKKLGYISPEIKQTENMFRLKWGELRGQSMLFAEGDNFQETLRRNEKIWTEISGTELGKQAVSIAPVLPSASTQQVNKLRWQNFWSQNKLDLVAKKVQVESAKLGFSPKAFEKSIQDLGQTTAPITIVSMSKSPLSFLSSLLIPNQDGSKSKLAITLLPDNEQTTDFFTPEIERKFGVRLISQNKFKQALEKEMKADIIKFICFSGFIVAMLVFILFKSIRRSLLALFPAAFAVASTFGVLGALGMPLNIFHIAALPLVIGLGADYGIFMVFQEIREPSPYTVKAVKISGLTTLAGFGVLIFARHPSMNSLGITVAAGISAALFCAVFILPSLLRTGTKSGEKHA